MTLIQSFRAKLEYYTLKQLLDDIVESTGYVKELQAVSYTHLVFTCVVNTYRGSGSFKKGKG